MMMAPHNHLMPFSFMSRVAKNTNDFRREIYDYVRGETRLSIDYIFPKCSIMCFIISKEVPNIKTKPGLSRMWNGNMHTLLV